MTSLVRLYTASAPEMPTEFSGKGLRQKMSRQALRSTPTLALPPSTQPYWPVPDAILSNSGRLVVLREKPNDRTKVEAVGTSDEQLRGVVFGDPVMHHMTLYARRVENLAFAAMTGKEIG